MRTKRKCVSDAERLATNISKMSCCAPLPTRFTLQGNKLKFLPCAGITPVERCTWADKGACPRYCKNASLTFETLLPDRGFLARYSVRCVECYGPAESARQIFCSHCNEILAGHMASPGAKVSDHLVTIRHLFHEAEALASCLRRNAHGEAGDRDTDLDLDQIGRYLGELEEWSRTIRIPTKSAVKRGDFESLVRMMSMDLARLSTVSSGCKSKDARRLPVLDIASNCSSDEWSDGSPSPSYASSSCASGSVADDCSVCGTPESHDLVPEDLDSCERYLRSCFDPLGDMDARTPPHADEPPLRPRVKRAALAGAVAFGGCLKACLGPLHFLDLAQGASDSDDTASTLSPQFDLGDDWEQ